MIRLVVVAVACLAAGIFASPLVLPSEDCPSGAFANWPHQVQALTDPRAPVIEYFAIYKAEPQIVEVHPAWEQIFSQEAMAAEFAKRREQMEERQRTAAGVGIGTAEPVEGREGVEATVGVRHPPDADDPDAEPFYERFVVVKSGGEWRISDIQWYSDFGRDWNSRLYPEDE